MNGGPMAEQKDIQSPQDLIRFLGSYSLLLEAQLTEIRNTVSNTLAKIMSHLCEAGERSEKGKRDAEAIFDDTYLNPDEKMQESIGAVQDKVDDVINEALSGGSGSEDDGSFGKELQDAIGSVSATFQQLAGKLDNVDTELQNRATEIMGELSSDDVVAQRLDHVIFALNAMSSNLGQLLLDFNSKKPEDYSRFASSLCDYTFQQYTMEEEKEVFGRFFNPPGKKAG